MHRWLLCHHPSYILSYSFNSLIHFILSVIFLSLLFYIPMPACIKSTLGLPALYLIYLQLLRGLCLSQALLRVEAAFALDKGQTGAVYTAPSPEAWASVITT